MSVLVSSTQKGFRFAARPTLIYRCIPRASLGHHHFLLVTKKQKYQVHCVLGGTELQWRLIYTWNVLTGGDA